MLPQEQLLLSREQMDALPKIVAPLLSWYGSNARTLPWREDPKPYHVWVSEIMLQQTRVEAVREYYRRFLLALPTVEALAEVSEDKLLKLWQGLGYYNRARNLQKAARVVMRQFDGRLPASYGALLSLPGIGEYTAGAIASIAFGIPVPAVDGNVLRVFSRLLASYSDIAHPAVKQAMRQLILPIIPPARPGDFNQAVMELGATVCVPNGPPLCTACPLANLCGARQGGIAQELPVKAPKKARRTEERTVVLLLAEGQVLLSRRGGVGLLSGMYEPLNLDGHLTGDAVEEVLSQLGATPKRLLVLRDSKHLFTHVEWRMKGYLATTSLFSPPDGFVWVGKEALAEGYPLPSAFRAYTQQLPIWLEELSFEAP